MEDMANNGETIERLAKNEERLRILLLAKSCKDLNELIQKLEARAQVEQATDG